MMKDMKMLCEEESLGLTCSAEYKRDDARVIEWKSKRERKGRTDKMNQRMEALEKSRSSKEHA